MGFQWCINSRYRFDFFESVANVVTSDPLVATILQHGDPEIICGQHNGEAQIQFDASLNGRWYRCDMNLLVFDCAHNEFFAGITLREPVLSGTDRCALG